MPASSGRCNGIAPRADGAVLVVGAFVGDLRAGGTDLDSVGLENDAFAVALGGDGSVRWGISFGSSSEDVAYGAALSGEGWAVAGVVSGDVGVPVPPGSGRDLFVVALDAGGAARWADGLDFGGGAVSLSGDGSCQGFLARLERR